MQIKKYLLWRCFIFFGECSHQIVQYSPYSFSLQQAARYLILPLRICPHCRCQAWHL